MLGDDPAVHPYRTEMTSPTDIRTSRRRDRDARATGSTRAQEEKKSRGRLPSAPRERRPLLAALAVILIVGGALLAGLLAARIDQREEMLIVVKPIEAGHVIALEDLASMPVAANSSILIPASRANEIVGQTAKVALDKGELVQTTQITDSSPTQDGRSVVGLSLEAGRFPAAGLSAGDVVSIVNVSADGSTPISGAQVLDAVPTSGKDGNWTSGATVSVLVPSAQGSSAAALGASGNAAVVVTAAGQPIGDH